MANGLFAYRPTVALIGYGAPICVDTGFIGFYILQCLLIVQAHGRFLPLFIAKKNKITDALVYVIAKHSMTL